MVNLDYQRKDGTTLREHLKSWCRQSGKWDERLNPPDIPQQVAYLWDWFWQIMGGRGESGFWMAVEAWCQLTSTRLAVWEVEALGRMHSEYERAMSKKIKEK